jgi:hypothetical protein
MQGKPLLCASLSYTDTYTYIQTLAPHTNMNIFEKNSWHTCDSEMLNSCEVSDQYSADTCFSACALLLAISELQSISASNCSFFGSFVSSD